MLLDWGMAFVLGVGLSLDAFAVCCTVALCGAVSMGTALRVAGSFGFFQGVMPLLGWFLMDRFGGMLVSIDHWIVFILLGFVGGKMFVEGFRMQQDVHCPVGMDLTSGKSLLFLSLGTSIDALAVGGSFSAMNLPVFSSSAIIAVVTFCVCILGLTLAGKLPPFRRGVPEIIGGAVLILIGTKILLEHMGWLSV